MSIWDYTGNKRVATNSGVGDTLEWVSPDNEDTYYIMVSASTQVPDVIGTYSLALTVLDTFRDRNDNTWDDATLIILGNPNQGAISPENDKDYFKFAAEKGITYLVRLDSAAGENASVTIEDSGGEVLATNRGGGQQISWTAPSDEGLHICVGGPSLTGLQSCRNLHHHHRGRRRPTRTATKIRPLRSWHSRSALARPIRGASAPKTTWTVTSV